MNDNRIDGSVRIFGLPAIVLALTLLGLLAVREVRAVPVTAQQAKTAAENWLNESRGLCPGIGAAVSSVRTCASTDGVSFHVARVSGGGFVVVGADTRIDPVILVSDGADLVEDERNPLWALLTGDLAARQRHMTQTARRLSASVGTGLAVDIGPEAKWRRLLRTEDGQADGPVRRLLSTAAGRQTIADVRVAPLLTTAWSQADCSNWGEAGETTACYNYYTPNRWPCGCVATAGAQIMRYFRFPTHPVEAATYACEIMTNKIWFDDYSYTPDCAPIQLTMKGGTYNWNLMPEVPADGCTDAQREAIGRLTYDVGVSCGTAYCEDGGSAAVYMLVKRLVDRFGYSNAVGVTFDAEFYGFGYSLARLKAATIPCLDAGLPTALGISSGRFGHAVVGDGYGYEHGDFCLHINLGWANASGGNAWYLPPDIDEYDVIDTVVYNIFTDRPAGSSIVSGRVLNQGGGPVSGVRVVAVQNGREVARADSGENGIYALFVPPGRYDVVAAKDGQSASRTVDVAPCLSTDYTDDGSYTMRNIPRIGNVPDTDLSLLTRENPQDDPDPAESRLFAAVEPIPAGKAPYAAAAVVYDGYMRDASGRIVGTIQVKAAKGKLDKTTGALSSKLTATVQMTGGAKKISFKGGVADEKGTVSGLAAAGHELAISLGENGLSGTFDGLFLEGARNVFTAKDAVAKTAASEAERKWIGALNVVGDEVALSVTVAKKGKVKITGTVKGAKVSATSQLLVGNPDCCIPVVIAKKANLAFNLWLKADGSAELAGITPESSPGAMVAGRIGQLGTGAKFRIEGGDAPAVSALPGLLTEFLPDGLDVAQNGTKWIVAGGAKAGKVMLVRGTTDVDLAKAGANPSGLKLTYKAKDGSFKGSFKAYALVGTKLKAYSFTVSGVMVGGVGHGFATLKKPAIVLPVVIQ